MTIILVCCEAMPIKQFRIVLLPILIVLALLPTQINLSAVVDVDPFIYALTTSKETQKKKKLGDIKVFIAIKTSISGVHGSRMAEIQKTWLQDVLVRPEVDLKFFAYVSPKVAATVESNASLPWIVRTPKKCGRKRVALCCKDELMFRYYYEHYVLSHNSFSPWFCSFDDDNYVLVDNLLKVLVSYQRQNVTKVYVGRPSMHKGIPWESLNNELVIFLTGGAGYCVSRELMEFGRAAFLNLTNHCAATSLPDDMAIGHTVTSRLGVAQRLDEHFHSHLEIHIRDTLPRDEISKQVSFGYNNKFERREAMNGFPNVNILYSPEDDPMLFKSLRAFLQREAAMIT